MSRTCCKHCRCGIIFLCNKWGKTEKGIACSNAGQSIPGIYGKMTMTYKRAKRMSRTYTKHPGTCLRSVSETLQCKTFHGIFTLTASSRRVCLNLMVLWDSDTANFRPFHREGELVGCFGFSGPLRQYFSLYWAVSQREGEREERQRRVKMSKQPSPTPTASAIGPCPTIIQIVGRPSTGILPRTIAPPNYP